RRQPRRHPVYARHRDRRALRSFPTRRSSDLVGADLDLMRAIADRLGLQAQFVEDAYALLVPGVAAGRFETAISALSVDDNDLQRSEEHTSELQSRENLVCRLLLDKKKRASDS